MNMLLTSPPIIGFLAIVTSAQHVDVHSNVSDHTLPDFEVATHEMATPQLQRDVENKTITKEPSSGGGQPEVTYVPIMTDEQREAANYVAGTVGDVIAPFAVLVTVINVVVFMHKSMRCSTSYYVVGLSIAQLLTLGVEIGADIYKALIDDPAQSYGYFFYNLHLLGAAISIFRRGSYIVMCLVSLERFYAIARPLHIKEFILVRRPVLFIAISYLLTAAFHIYSFLKFDILPLRLPSGVTVYYLHPTDIYIEYRSIVQAFDVNAKVMCSYIPLFSLIGLNVVTLVLLKRHSLERQKMKMTSNAGEEAKKQRQLTVTILGATLCYVILSIPLACHSLVAGLLPEFSRTGRERNLYRFLLTLSYAAVLVSCFTDFVSFLLLSSAYRRTFLVIFRVKLFSEQKRGIVSEDTNGTSVSNTNDTSIASM